MSSPRSHRRRHVTPFVAAVVGLMVLCTSAPASSSPSPSKAAAEARRAADAAREAAAEAARAAALAGKARSTSTSTSAAVGPAQGAVDRAQAKLTALNVRLSIEAQKIHDARALLAALRADLAASEARAERARAAATADQARVDSLARWAYETGGPVSWMTGLFTMNNVNDFVQGENMLAHEAGHAGAVARTAAAARDLATKDEAGRRSIAASVAGTVAQLNHDGAEMQAAVDAQQHVVAGLQRELQHRLALAIAARAAAAQAARQAASASSKAKARAAAAAAATAAAQAAAAAAAAKAVSGGQPDPSGGQPGPSGGQPPPSAPTPSAPTPSQQQVDTLILSIWGQGTAGTQAQCIADHESGDNANSRNPSSGSAGLFQLMPFWWDGNNQFGWSFDPYDAQQNAIHAHLIWEQDGWAPWTTAHSCGA